MSYRKHGLKALGLSLAAVLGLMAFMAVVANADFLYFQRTTKIVEAESEPVISAHTDGTLLVPSLNYKILCQKVESDPLAKVKLLANSAVAHGQLILKECESFTLNTNALLGTCTPSSPGSAAGEILVGGLAVLVSHEGKRYILFMPSEGKQFGTVLFPETCALLAETVNLGGSFVAECGELNSSGVYVGGSCANHRVEQLLRSAPQELFPSDKLQFFGREASLDGIAAVKFGAPCAGCSWGGDPLQARFIYLEAGGATKTLAVESQPVVSAHTNLTLLIPAKNLKIICQNVGSDAAAPLELLGNSTVGHGHLIFKGCESFTIKTNTFQKNCTPLIQGEKSPSGLILAGGLAELILHPANNTMVLFKPLTGKAFTTVELPELCALAETSNVTGEFVAECGELNGSGVYVSGNCATHRVTQLLQAVSTELAKTLGAVLKFGANEAFLDGISSVQFGDLCEGCSWGGDAV